MKKLSLRKLSLLSLVLMGASAIAGAMIPSKSVVHKKSVGANGHIVNEATSSDPTCTAGGIVSCFDTDTNAANATTATTEGEGQHSSNTAGSGNTTANDAE